mmetsp:Transcript_22388/g.38235  ORF Transcript_22388/g.38235 Transcript_22388/m.38235 type:complete len:223 (-) Transcript_22388:1344-2012(-)
MQRLSAPASALSREVSPPPPPAVPRNAPVDPLKSLRRELLLHDRTLGDRALGAAPRCQCPRRVSRRDHGRPSRPLVRGVQNEGLRLLLRRERSVRRVLSRHPLGRRHQPLDLLPPAVRPARPHLVRVDTVPHLLVPLLRLALRLQALVVQPLAQLAIVDERVPVREHHLPQVEHAAAPRTAQPRVLARLHHPARHALALSALRLSLSAHDPALRPGPSLVLR